MKDIEPPIGEPVEPEKKYNNPTAFIQWLREHEPYSGYYDEMAELESRRPFRIRSQPNIESSE